MRLIIPECRFYFWRTGRVRRIPLVADTGTERIGFCFSSTLTPQRWQWLPLLIALRRGVIDRAFLLHENTYATLQEHAVPVLPQWAFLREPRAWIVDRRTPADARRAMREINRERLARPFPPR